MYVRLPGLIFGFHGCDRDVAERVLLGKDLLRPSTNSYDWLGEGIYFWENDPARAYDYAVQLSRSRRKRRPAIQEPFVIGAVIDLGLCLNLLDSEYLEVVQQAHGTLVATYRQADLPLPANKVPSPDDGELLVRELDCAVINSIHEQRIDQGLPAFDTVRAVFQEGQPVYPTAGFRRRSHVQVCVRGAGSIKAYFRAMRPDGSWLSLVEQDSA